MRVVSVALTSAITIVCSTVGHAQTLLSESVESNKLGSMTTTRTISIGNDKTVDLKHVNLQGGNLLLRSEDQSAETMQVLDAFCSQYGMQVSTDSEIHLLPDTVASLPCVNVGEAPRAVESFAELSGQQSNQSLLASCGNVWIDVILGGPTIIERSTSDVYWAQADFEYDEGPSQRAEMDGSIFPGCGFGSSTYIWHWGQITLPFTCMAPSTTGTYSAFASASICDQTYSDSMSINVVP